MFGGGVRVSRVKVGNAVPVLSFVDQLEVDGEVCLLLSLVDIGARKRMEQELRLLERST